MNLEQRHNIYFIGIGGIGMSALARYFRSIGKKVAGYDRTQTSLTAELQDQGISIHFDEGVEYVEESFKQKDTTLVIYTPAVPESHLELEYFKSNGFIVLKRSVVLGMVTKHTTCLAVAGTHGKTTTTSILGHLLYESDQPVTAFLGGIAENYNSNYISKGNEVTVVEADEFDRSFLTLSPDIACVTSMDADHLDIYGKKEALEDSFKAFAKCLKPNGKLFVKKGLPLDGITYAIDEDADYKAFNIRIENGSYVFDVQTPTKHIENLRFNLPGRHNLSNALIALAMAIDYGCPTNSLASALASYRGVKRRFTYQIKSENLVFIDDYAHHPEEINAVYNAVREMYPDKKVLVIFQPHLFSRTKDFANEFAQSLSKFDEVILLDIYPARELPIEGVTSKWLLDKIDHLDKKLIEKSDIVEAIQKSDATIIMTLGAGDIGEEVEHIKEKLSIAS